MLHQSQRSTQGGTIKSLVRMVQKQDIARHSCLSCYCFCLKYVYFNRAATNNYLHLFVDIDHLIFKHWRR